MELARQMLYVKTNLQTMLVWRLVIPRQPINLKIDLKIIRKNILKGLHIFSLDKPQ